jgi:hypothetical protein
MWTHDSKDGSVRYSINVVLDANKGTGKTFS